MRKLKSMDWAILFIALIFIASLTGILTMTLITGQFDSCDSTSDSKGAWTFYIGGTGAGTLSVNTADKTEGSGSLDLSVSTGWDIYFRKMSIEPDNWDFSQSPRLTFKLKLTSINPSLETRLKITTRTGNSSWETFEYTAFTLTEGAWNTLTVDLRNPATFPPDVTSIDLTKVRQFTIYHGSPTSPANNPMHILIDDIQTTGSSGPGPLTVTVSPTSKTIEKGQSASFTATASGGSGNYIYQWYEGTTPMTGKTSATLTVTPPNSGTFQYKAEVTSGSEVRSATATLFVNDPSQPSGTYTVLVTAEGNGTVTPGGSVTDVSSGTNMTLAATANSGFVFSKWVINDVENIQNPVTITVTENTVAKAYFIPETPGAISSGGGVTPSVSILQETAIIIGLGICGLLVIMVYRRKRRRG